MQKQFNCTRSCQDTIALLLLVQNLLNSQAQAAAKGQTEHHADLLRMTRESMNGSFTAKLNSLGEPLLFEKYAGSIGQNLVMVKAWLARVLYPLRRSKGAAVIVLDAAAEASSVSSKTNPEAAAVAAAAPATEISVAISTGLSRNTNRGLKQRLVKTGRNTSLSPCQAEFSPNAATLSCC